MPATSASLVLIVVPASPSIANAVFSVVVSESVSTSSTVFVLSWVLQESLDVVLNVSRSFFSRAPVFTP